MRLLVLPLFTALFITGCDPTGDQIKCECYSSYTSAGGDTVEDELLDSVTVVGDDGVSTYRDETCPDACLEVESDGATIDDCYEVCDSSGDDDASEG